MLTCKSLFGLGYRGERLIEPSKFGLRQVVGRGLAKRKPLVSVLSRVNQAKLDRGNTVKLPGHLARLLVPPRLRKGAPAPRWKPGAW